ncbi:MAG: YraN family protein [Nonlabens sp.]
MASHNELGKKGEELAREFLIKKGFIILATNYTYLKGEIDIIARLNKIIVVVEVKTRSTPEFGNPQDFLKPAQIQRLVQTANYFMENEVEEDLEVRFDIVAVIINKAGTQIEHLEDGFYHF